MVVLINEAQIILSFPMIIKFNVFLIEELNILYLNFNLLTNFPLSLIYLVFLRDDNGLDLLGF